MRRISFYLAVVCLPLADAVSQEGTDAVVPDVGRIYRASTVQRALPAFSADSFTVLKKPKIGLVLSGGGALGLSQIGVLQALEEAGIEPGLIVGTSIGSVIGGLYAAGYSVERLKRNARDIKWGDIMRVTEETRREFIAIDQRPSNDRSIFTLRFDGLKPVLPQAVSNGQKLTNLMNELALQGLYNTRSFDDLKIPFRAVATDLYSGKRVVIRDGLLGEAMRASSTIPVVFSPIMRDSLALVDGGLRSNIPVDVAVQEGCDIIIAVNTASPLRTNESISNPLETLDQVLNIVMYQDYAEQLSLANFVITPELSAYKAQDFKFSDSLIATGYRAGKRAAAAIAGLVRHSMLESIAGTNPEEPIAQELVPLPLAEVERILPGYEPEASRPESIVLSLMQSGKFEDVALRTTVGAPPEVYATRRPVITSIGLEGIRELNDQQFPEWITPGTSMAYSFENLQYVCEDILEVYRSFGYSLARIEASRFNVASGALVLTVNEGIISGIEVKGTRRTDPIVVLREFPMRAGEIFRFQRARQGLENLSGLDIFHQVHFEIVSGDSLPSLLIEVSERSSSTLAIGLLIDNERNGQILAELKDGNVFGSGTSLAALFFGGIMNQTYELQYNTNRMFYTRLQFGAEGFYDTRRFNEYADVAGLPENRFEQTVARTYDRRVYGGRATLGWYVQRFGMLRAGMRYEHQEVRYTDAEADLENHNLVALAFSSTIDTQNRLPYATEGLLMKASYETAQKALGSDVAFTKFSFLYELFFSDADELLTFHPRLLFGFGDRTMPKAEEFRLGGIYSFYGVRDNEYNGRQLFVGSLEARYLLPVQIIFDTYLSIRYDIGRTWANPENLKFENFRHGIGVALGLDTPIGPADFAVGRSFETRQDTDYPLSFSPVYLFFSIGVGLPQP